jgi:hypothetical protein
MTRTCFDARLQIRSNGIACDVEDPLTVLRFDEDWASLEMEELAQMLDAHTEMRACLNHQFR